MWSCYSLTSIKNWYDIMLQDDKYLALVTLNTGNHRFSHGTGNTVEEAENAAAKAALEQLANSGLQNLKRDDAAQSSLADAAGEKGAAKDENRYGS